MNTINWEWARSRILLAPHSTNLNCGSFGPTPIAVFEACTNLRYELASQPMDFFLRTSPSRLSKARTELASYLGHDSKGLIFTTNVSTAINLIANSWRFQPGDAILVTDHEYRAMRWAWERVAQRTGARIITATIPHLASDPQQIIDSIEPFLAPPVRLLFFSHVTSPTGLVLPASDLCSLARQRGIATVVDGAHAVATLNLDLTAIGADCYGGNLHKWLGAPTGSGFLAFQSSFARYLEPLVVSWGYYLGDTDPDSDDIFGSTPHIRRLEFEGTRDPCPWLVVPDAIAFQKSLGPQAIQHRQRSLVTFTRETLQRFSWLVPATPHEEALSGPMIAFQVILPITLDQLRAFLWDHHRIEIGLNQHESLGLLMRISCHFFTTHEEILQLAAALLDLENRGIA